MSTITSTTTNSTIDLLSRRAIDPFKQTPKYTDPLRAANPNPLSIATKPSDDGKETPQARAKLAAEGLVSTTLIEPILKQLRESNNTPPPFGPSSAEKQFSSMLDTKLADELVKAANFPLVARIASELMKNMPNQAPPRQSLDIKG